MTTTQAHSTAHRAFADTAAAYQLVPMDVRVLVALADRGGHACSDELESDLCLKGGTAIRRSLLNLRPTWAVGGDQRGRRADIRLTINGFMVVNDFMTRLNEFQLEEAA